MSFVSRRSTACLQKVFALLLFCAAATPSTYAEDGSESEGKRLSEVLVVTEGNKEKVVTGVNPKRVAEYPGAVTVVSEQEIDAVKPLSTIDVLQQVPGVNVTTEDGRGLRPNIGLRGIDPDRSREGVLILSDGVPIQPAVYGDRSAYYNVPVELVEQIEVIKGASSVLYGPSNVGGVVNFITKRPPAEAGSYFQVNETVREGALFDSMLTYGVTGDNGVGARLSYMNKHGETVRENTDVDVHDVNIRTIVPTHENGELSLRFNYYAEDAHTPGGLTPELFREDPDQSVRSDDVFHGNRISFDANYVQPLSKDLTLDALLYTNYFRRDWYIANGPDGIATSNSQFLRDFIVAGLEPRLRAGRWTVGTRLHHESLDDVGRTGSTPGSRNGVVTSEADLSTFAWASYVQRDIELFEKFVVTPGIRYEHVDQTRETALRTDPILGVTGGEAASAITNEIVGGANFNYEPAAGHNFFGGVMRSFEPPSFSEAIDPTTGTDTDLDAETSLTYEIGHRGRITDWLSTDTAIFWMDFDNKVVNEAGRLTNGGETRHRGIEFNLITTPADALRANIGATLLDTEFRSGANIGNDLPMAPDARLSWGLSYRILDAWAMRLDGFYVDEQFTDAVNTKEESLDGNKGQLPSYDVWNLRTDFHVPNPPVARELTLFAGVANLFDEEYRERRQATFNGIIPGLTRTFYAGIEARF